MARPNSPNKVYKLVFIAERVYMLILPSLSANIVTEACTNASHSLQLLRPQKKNELS